eukprot:557721-Prymnesium_polylepis.1
MNDERLRVVLSQPHPEVSPLALVVLVAMVGWNSCRRGGRHVATVRAGYSRQRFETGRWGAGAAAGAAEGKLRSGWAAAWRFRTL